MSKRGNSASLLLFLLQSHHYILRRKPKPDVQPTIDDSHRCMFPDSLKTNDSPTVVVGPVGYFGYLVGWDCLVVKILYLRTF